MTTTVPVCCLQDADVCQQEWFSSEDDDDEDVVGIEQVESVPFSSEAGQATHAASFMSLNDTKAGMEGLDTDKINAIILQNSRGSAFHSHEERRQVQRERRVAAQVRRAQSFTAEQLARGLKAADRVLAQLRREYQQPTSDEQRRTLVHLDMDAFFAAVEMRDQPALRRVPMAVGSDSMLSTSNYLARRFGVRAAMPGFIARKLCPQLQIVPLDYAKYKLVSRQIRAVLALYDADMLPMGLDEAYLDITEHLRWRATSSTEQRTFSCEQACCCCDGVAAENAVADNPEAVCCDCGGLLDAAPRLFGVSLDEAVRELRFRVHAATRLTASAGLADNTMLAKLCSERRKPNGQFSLAGAPPDQVLAEVRALHVRRVPGIGRVQEHFLRALQIERCADLYEQRAVLQLLCGAAQMRHLMRAALGLGEMRLPRADELEPRKSVSVERTFAPQSNLDVLLDLVAELADALSGALRKRRVAARTVTLKLKLASFEVRTREGRLAGDGAAQLSNVAAHLLRREVTAAGGQLTLRLLGLRAGQLLFEDGAGGHLEKRRQLSIVGMMQPLAADQKTSVDKEIADCADDVVEQNHTESRVQSAQSSHSDVSHQSVDEVGATSTQSKEEEKKLVCPVCDTVQLTRSMDDFNRHLDTCLSRQSIQEAVRQVNISLTAESSLFVHQKVNSDAVEVAGVEARKSLKRCTKSGDRYQKASTQKKSKVTSSYTLDRYFSVSNQ